MTANSRLKTNLPTPKIGNTFCSSVIVGNYAHYTAHLFIDIYKEYKFISHICYDIQMHTCLLILRNSSQSIAIYNETEVSLGTL